MRVYFLAYELFLITSKAKDSPLPPAQLVHSLRVFDVSFPKPLSNTSASPTCGKFRALGAFVTFMQPGGLLPPPHPHVGC